MRRATHEFAGAVTSVFWNIDTCPVPRGFDAHLVGPCMKRYLEKLGYTGPLTMCVAGTLTDVSDEILRAVSSTGFLVYIDPYGKSLAGYYFDWNYQYPPPANIMVITHSTDRNSAIDLRMLQGRGYNIIRPYPLGPASSTNAWESFLLAESGELEEDYPIETAESSWVCTVCYGLTGQGFDNFTAHISSQRHAYKKSRWTPRSTRAEDEEYEDEIAVEAHIEPPWDWSPALESQPPPPPPPPPLHMFAPQVCAGCNVTILPQPWESFPFVCHRCATTILPKPPHWFATPSESHGKEPPHMFATPSESHGNEIVNRIQKLRKLSGLEPTDVVEVYFESLDEDESVSQQVVYSQEQYIRDSIGSPLLLSCLMPPHAVVIADEVFRDVAKLSYKISLAREALKFNEEAILALYSGDVKFASGLQTYLLSRDHSNLKSEFQAGDGKITVSCIEKLPAVTVVLGEHLHVTVGDYLLSKRKELED